MRYTLCIKVTLKIWEDEMGRNTLPIAVAYIPLILIISFLTL